MTILGRVAVLAVTAPGLVASARLRESSTRTSSRERQPPKSDTETRNTATAAGLTINLLGELPFQFGNSLLEHLPMDRRCGGGEVAPGACQCQLNRAPCGRAFAL